MTAMTAMTTMTTMTAVLATAVLIGCGAKDNASIPASGPGPGPTASCPIIADDDGFFQLTSAKSDYWVRLPPDYDLQTPRPRRLLVALHGCGDTAFKFATWAAVPAALRASQDYIAISIGGGDGRCWDLRQDPDLVTAAIAHVRSCFYVHQKQIVLGGFSSGGMLAYKLAMSDAGTYAGVLIEDSGLSQGLDGGSVDAALTNAAWKINIAHTARTRDGLFAIAGVRADRDKMIARGFPLQYRELDGVHSGNPDDWSEFLIPKMAGWASP